VEVVGVVMNKVLEDRMDYVSDFARRGFQRLGVELLGVIPMQKMLAEPSLAQIAEKIKGTFLCNDQSARNLAAEVVIGAVSSANLLPRLSPRTLLIAPGDREDIVLAAITEAAPAGLLAGLILSDGLRPHPKLVSLLEQTSIPVVFSPVDSYSIAKRIQSLTVKIQPEDFEKINHIQNLITKHLDVERLLAKL
jgi:BioD-like phosphotransacetylase family protein